MDDQRQAVHRSIVVVDVEGFGDRRRTNPNQTAVRAGLYAAVREAFGNAGIPWERCRHEDRGDGMFVLVPADVPKAPLVEALPQELVTALDRHNRTHGPQERIRLRMALHAGEVNYDTYGVTAASINLAFRLLDAGLFRRALADSPGVLAVIVSKWFFDEVVRNSTASRPGTYREVHVAVKETVTSGWICLPDHPYQDVGPPPPSNGGGDPGAPARWRPRVPRSPIGRLLLAVAAAGLLLTGYLALGPTAGGGRPPVRPPAAGVGCRAETCDGRSPRSLCDDPKTTSTLADAQNGKMVIELRYSSACQAAWGRINFAAVRDEVEVAGDRGQTQHDFVQNGDDKFSPMIPASPGTRIRACGIATATQTRRCTDYISAPGG